MYVKCLSLYVQLFSYVHIFVSEFGSKVEFFLAFQVPVTRMTRFRWSYVFAQRHYETYSCNFEC